MKLKKVLAGVMVAAMLVGNAAIPALAEQKELADGSYTARVTMYQMGKANSGANGRSMCNPLFVEKADVVLTEENAEITAYVAFPVPAFPTDGVDGTVKDVSVSYNGEDYTADLDLETKTPMPMRDTVALFGIEKGVEVPTQGVKFTVPREAINEPFLRVKAYVGVVMHTNVQFDMTLEDLKLVKGTEGGSSAAEPEDKNKKTLTVRATVAAAQSTYTVTIPEAISMGELDLKNDNEKSYDVKVDIEAGNDEGYVKISAADNGALKAGNSSISFTNDFGTREFRQSGTESATLTVAAKELKNKKPGDYTGTTTFNIEYLTK